GSSCTPRRPRHPPTTPARDSRPRHPPTTPPKETAMLPRRHPAPPFALTGASHVRLGVTDLTASRDFYRDTIGLLVTAEEGDFVYLRGYEEAAHHSLVLERADRALAHRVGLRVRSDVDIEAGAAYFAAHGI